MIITTIKGETVLVEIDKTKETVRAGIELGIHIHLPLFIKLNKT